MGLGSDLEKTKIMKVVRKSVVCGVRIGDQVIEQVEEMKYWGGDI